MATISQVKAVLAARRDELLALPYVTGVGATVLDGEPAILVLMARRPTAQEWLPSYIDGVRIVTRLTGTIQPS